MKFKKNKQFNKNVVGTVALTLIGGSGIFAATEDDKKPNIIIILADDLGSVDLNSYGSKDLYTPNLDKLRSDGIKFTQFYVAAPVCSPSRGAFLTGRYPQHNGQVDNGGDIKMNSDETTIADMLKTANYKTGLIGKWHIGGRKPNESGFDYFYGHLNGCIENYKHNFLDWDKGTIKKHDLWQNKTQVHEDGKHFGDLIARESISFIEKNKNDPFFMYIAFNNPHYPVQPLPHHYERCKDMKEPRRSYAAFVSTMDEQIGRIIKKLEDLKLKKNTLIIFFSDNGHAVTKRNKLFVKGLKGKSAEAVSGGSAGIYKGKKKTLWEGGIRIPCLMSWPDKIQGGETRTQVATSMDLLPTIAEYTGAKPPAKILDGKSITNIIASDTATSPHSVLHWRTKLKFGTWAVREGKWKLVKEKKEKSLFLSDMEADPGETNNLAEKYPEIVTRLENMHNGWVKKVQGD